MRIYFMLGIMDGPENTEIKTPFYSEGDCNVQKA